MIEWGQEFNNSTKRLRPNKIAQTWATKGEKEKKMWWPTSPVTASSTKFTGERGQIKSQLLPSFVAKYPNIYNKIVYISRKEKEKWCIWTKCFISDHISNNSVIEEIKEVIFFGCVVWLGWSWLWLPSMASSVHPNHYQSPAQFLIFEKYIEYFKL